MPQGGFKNEDTNTLASSSHCGDEVTGGNISTIIEPSTEEQPPTLAHTTLPPMIISGTTSAEEYNAASDSQDDASTNPFRLGSKEHVRSRLPPVEVYMSYLTQPSTLSTTSDHNVLPKIEEDVPQGPNSETQHNLKYSIYD